MKDDKASSGPDELVPRFLKGIRERTVQPLTLLFRKVVEKTEVPKDWKQANVSPIFKSGNKSKTSHYRPVSLTSQICKIFEAITGIKWSSFYKLMD